MEQLDVKAALQRISSEVSRRAAAANALSAALGLEKQNIFYEYVKGNLPDRGVVGDDGDFFFHGLGCSVRVSASEAPTELEFGPGGDPCALDPGSLCHLLGISVDDGQAVLSELSGLDAIRLAAPDLAQMIQSGANLTWASQEQEIDAMVADRYVWADNENSK